MKGDRVDLAPLGSAQDIPLGRLTYDLDCDTWQDI